MQDTRDRNVRDFQAELESIFSSGGSLSRGVDRFRARPFQLEMARAVAAAIAGRKILVAEAGTGTGKTFAYLVPALLSGGKVILSTGTKTLQDQLFDRDIPTVRNALKAPVTVAMLKGRANYVCHHHLERALAQGRLPTREDAVHLQKIVRYARTTLSGDRSDLADVPENAGIWSYVTSTRENCLGSACSHYDRCFVMEARRRALAADVVVVNHHLFFADVMLRDEGVTELLPAANTVIFDEAHQLPETASLFFGERVSTSQLTELARDARMEAAVSAKDFAPLPAAALALDKAARDLRLARGEDSARIPFHVLRGDRGFGETLSAMREKLDQFIVVIGSQAGRSEELEKCRQRGTALAEQIDRWRTESDGNNVRWIEVFSHSLQLNATPLSIAEIFRKQMSDHARAWIFTSATLSVSGDFSHYCGELGLPDAQTASWASPFDFSEQALLYVPKNLPDPNTPEYTRAALEAMLPVIEASGGGAFLLFTSLRAMREGHEFMVDAFSARGWKFPLLVQGGGSRTELLARFRDRGNAVLIGSHSFWEGVDVRGEALTLVVIDRLPFASPDDPVLAARIDKLNREGRNAFMEYQLPEAVITLKQGAGRLIRDETDRGVLMICDPRLVSRAYGKRIVHSLPPMKRTRELPEVTAFLEACRGRVAAPA